MIQNSQFMIQNTLLVSQNTLIVNHMTQSTRVYVICNIYGLNMIPGQLKIGEIKRNVEPWLSSCKWSCVRKESIESAFVQQWLSASIPKFVKGYPCLYLFTLPVELNSVSFVIVCRLSFFVVCRLFVVCGCLLFVVVCCLLLFVVCCCLSFLPFVVWCCLSFLLFVVCCYLSLAFCCLLFVVGFYLSLFGRCRLFLFVGSPGGLGGPGISGGPGRQCGPGLSGLPRWSGWSRWSGGSNSILRTGVRVVLVIKFVNAYGLHGVHNQVIENTWDFKPVKTHTHGKEEQYSVWAKSAIPLMDTVVTPPAVCWKLWLSNNKLVHSLL